MAIVLKSDMGTIRVFLSFLLSLLILASVPAARTWAVQCPADLPMFSTTDHASVGDQCHISNTPDRHASASSPTVPSFPITGPALHKIGVHTPRNDESATTGRTDVPVLGDMPVFLRTVTLLI
jgi:hypothetical protein